MSRRQRLAVTLAVAVALVGIVGIAAYGAIPGPNGAIRGCVKTSGGQVRVIDPAAGGACGSSETALDWNLTGGQGSQGPPGGPGPQGGAGQAGSSGYERIVVQASTDQSGDGESTADCSTGKRVLMGGYELASSGPMRVVTNAPTSGGTGWDVQVTGAVGNFVVSAICATATTPQS